MIEASRRMQSGHLSEIVVLRIMDLRQGFEPTVPLWTLRLSRTVDDPRNDEVYLAIRDESSGEVPTVVPSSPSAVSSPVFPPNLARVIDAWDDLPATIKAAIPTLVDPTASTYNRKGKGRLP